MILEKKILFLSTAYKDTLTEIFVYKYIECYVLLFLFKYLSFGVIAMFLVQLKINFGLKSLKLGTW